MAAVLLFRGYAVAGYIAVFAGMSSKTVIPSLVYAPIFGLSAGIVAILFARLFVGYGGKAGSCHQSSLESIGSWPRSYSERK